MKSLMDIQQDIRKLEINVEDIVKRIRNINSAIDSLRNADQSVNLNFSKIELLAGQFRFRQHPLHNLESGLRRLYLEMLLNIVRLDREEDVAVNRLVFIQWLQIQSRLEWSLESLYADCLGMKKEAYYEFANGLTKKFRESFLVDAMITALMDGNPNREILEYVAEQSIILGVEKDRIRTLSLLAKVVLCQNVQEINRVDLEKFLDCVKSYRHYIDNSVIEDVIKNLRDIAVAVKDDECSDFVWKAQQLDKVKKGDTIAVCRIKTKIQGKCISYVRKELKATSSGVLFRFRDQNTNYGVIAHESDSKEAIKAWIRARR